MKKEKLLALIDQFGTFSEQFPDADLPDFGLWLHQRRSSPPRAHRTSRAAIPDPFTLERQLGGLLWRFNRFTRFYTRKAFADLDITTVDEFMLLWKVGELDGASKKEIYDAVLYEITTGAQMLKRLLELGLLTETPDANDKRIKRVQLTEKGREMWQTAFERLGLEVQLKFGNLTLTEKEQLLAIFIRLDAFHADIYFNEPDVTIPDLAKKKIYSNEVQQIIEISKSQ